eukprot:CAMPEP_0196741978 /NCGR_PEP_ID=MMETSP1091-20130531/43665_1 /TAXON_ID=302021 /ORGANISM="Rhodomonas sp., Strain CCMP768" /LENGTH=55 /DNA_ID=CAMNT_0042087871 /DNA_START=129 /DNA_END=292 /DNA_ORIENTATION=+
MIHCTCGQIEVRLRCLILAPDHKLLPALRQRAEEERAEHGDGDGGEGEEEGLVCV